MAQPKSKNVLILPEKGLKLTGRVGPFTRVLTPEDALRYHENGETLLSGKLATELKKIRDASKFISLFLPITGTIYCRIGSPPGPSLKIADKTTGWVRILDGIPSSATVTYKATPREINPQKDFGTMFLFLEPAVFDNGKAELLYEVRIDDKKKETIITPASGAKFDVHLGLERDKLSLSLPNHISLCGIAPGGEPSVVVFNIHTTPFGIITVSSAA